MKKSFGSLACCRAVSAPAAIAVAFWLISPGAEGRAATVEFLAGHGDLGIEGNGTEIELHWHIGGEGNSAITSIGTVAPSGEGVEYEPGHMVVRLDDNHLDAPTFQGTYVGVPEDGRNIYISPQNNQPGKLFLGIATEELDNNFYSGATFRLTNFSAPSGAQFALTQFNGASFDSLFETQNGLDESDQFSLGLTHDHANWVFSDPGLYDLTIRADADLLGGGVQSDEATFRFVVGSATAVPEPGPLLALAGIAMVGMVTQRVRRKRGINREQRRGPS